MHTVVETVHAVKSTLAAPPAWEEGDVCPDCPHCEASQSLILCLCDVTRIECLECGQTFDAGRLLAYEDGWEEMVAWLAETRQRLATWLAAAK